MTAVQPAHWRVRTKVGAVLVLPAVAFAVLAGVQTSDAVRDATALDDFAEQVALGRQVTGLVHELQRERDRTAGELARFNASPRQRDADELAQALAGEREAVDAARQRLGEAARSLPPSGPRRQAYERANAALADVAQLRIGGQTGWLRQRAVFDGYSRAVDALLAMLPEPAAAADAQLVSQVRGYADLARAKELSAQVRGRLFAVLHGRVALGAAELEELANLRAQRSGALDRFRADATPYQVARYDEKVRGQTVRNVARLEQSTMEQARGAASTVEPGRWWTESTQELELLRAVEATLLNEAVEGTQELSAARWRVTGLATAGILLVLLVALLASVLIGSSMVRSLRLLREEALEVAQRALPEVLERVRASSGAVPAIQVEPMSVRTTDEVGDVADAFTAVHRSAVRLAVEQAAMRRNVNAMFVNFARRSQLLVERQLELLDDLEQEEDDPDQLANLFRLDHLAARMRRNDENLLVLAGADSTRVQREPAALLDVLRAAQSEVEHYTRVEFGVIDRDIEVAAHAVNDLVHLVAELLDNATAFSPPDSAVIVEARRVGDRGVLLVEDRGIGISPDQLAELNERLATPPMVDVAVSRMMGLVVVARLAARHGVKVELRPAGDRGTIADVTLPTSVLVPRALVGRLAAGQPPTRQREDVGPAPRAGFGPPLALESGPAAPPREPAFRGYDSRPGTPGVGRPLDTDRDLLGAGSGAAPTSGGPVGGPPRGLPAWSDLTGATGVNGTDPFSTRPPSSTEPLPQRRPGERRTVDGEVAGPPPLIPRQFTPGPNGAGAGEGPFVPPVSVPPVSGPPAPYAPPAPPPAATAPPAPVRPGSAPPSWPPVAPGAEDAGAPPPVPGELAAALDMTAEIPKVRPDAPAPYAPASPYPPAGADSPPDPRMARFADETMELPIFRELESAWFRTRRSVPEAAPATNGAPVRPGEGDEAMVAAGSVGSGVSAETPVHSWQTAADDGWRAAAVAADVPVTDTTDSGLPKRVPMAQLVPGGVDKGASTTQKRTPEAVRGLLSAYHRGVQRGRTQPKGADPNTPESSTAGQQTSQAGKEQEA